MEKKCIVCNKEYKIEELVSEKINEKEITIYLAGFCSSNCMKKWIPDNIDIDTEENKKIVKQICKYLTKMRNSYFVFDEDTTKIMIPIFNRRIFSLFNNEDRNYLVHLYYKSTKWHIGVMGETTLFSLMFDKWNDPDKKLWTNSSEKFIQSEIDLELENPNVLKDRKIWRNTIIMHMNIFSSVPLELNGTEYYEKTESS